MFTVMKIQDVDLNFKIWLTNLIVYLYELSFALSGIKNGSIFAKIAYRFFYRLNIIQLWHGTQLKKSFVDVGKESYKYHITASKEFQIKQ